jgi:hypothetical protein
MPGLASSVNFLIMINDTIAQVEHKYHLVKLLSLIIVEDSLPSTIKIIIQDQPVYSFMKLKIQKYIYHL